MIEAIIKKRTCYYTQNLHFQEILSQLLENAVVFIVILKQSQAIGCGKEDVLDELDLMDNITQTSRSYVQIFIMRNLNIRGRPEQSLWGIPCPHAFDLSRPMARPAASERSGASRKRRLGPRHPRPTGSDFCLQQWQHWRWLRAASEEPAR